MIKVYLVEKEALVVKRDGVRDLLRLFFGAARFFEAEPGLLMYETSENWRLICGFSDQQALAYQVHENEPWEAVRGRNLANGSCAQRATSVLPLGPVESAKYQQRKLKRCLYNCLASMTGKSFPWGSLSGIRPSYIAAEYLRTGKTESETAQLMQETYALKVDKAALVTEVAATELAIIQEQNPQGVHLYIHVPFCHTRCSYCSFTAQDAINPKMSELERYLEALMKELSAVLKDFVAPINSIYIGGGTPSIFTSQQLERLLKTLDEVLDLSQCPEFCFEAGRSDSLDAEKLERLKVYGVNRICINPQTMQAKTLQAIGRPETPEKIRACFHMAKELGFTTINMDLIAGLGDETPLEFLDSLEQVIALGPESITVHSLARKNKSNLDLAMKTLADVQEDLRPKEANKLLNQLGDPNQEIEDMLREAYKRLSGAAYHPYYLYRQKDGLGGLENVGFSKPGHACSYNVCMMSDAQSVLAFGASAISKQVTENGTKRYPNQRKAYEYIRKIDEQIQKKYQVFSDIFLENLID